MGRVRLTKAERAAVDKFYAEHKRLLNKEYPPHIGRAVWAAFYRKRKSILPLLATYRAGKERAESLERYFRVTERELTKYLETPADGSY